MARRKREYKREILPDPKYHDVLVTKFINSMMWDGNKRTAEQILYDAVDVVAQRSGRPGIELFHEAVEKVRPLVEVRSRRVGGATYQVPTEVRPERRNTLAIRWLILSARERGEKNMKDRLANELFEASQSRGNAVKKRDEVHRMAEANRAFAHYRW